jgi:hypothetical protein
VKRAYRNFSTWKIRLLGTGLSFAILAIGFNNCGEFKTDTITSESVGRLELVPGDTSGGAAEALWNRSQNGMNAAMSSSTTAGVTGNCSVTGDFPLRTHYRTGVGPSPGGTDVPSLLNPNMDAEVASGKDLVKVYQDYAPRSGVFLEDNYAMDMFPDAQIKSSLQFLCVSDSSSIKFKQTSKAVVSLADLNQLITPNDPSFQVIHGVIFRKNLFTIIVPPRWNPSTTYTSLISNGYGLNGQLISSTGFFRELGRAYGLDQKGAVGFMWNGGGGVADYTVHDIAWTDFNDFMKLAVPALSLNPDKAIATGGSRGGITAINMAAHPLVTSLRFAYVVAMAPPSDWDQMMRHVSTTVPMLFGGVEGVVGYVGSWRNGFRSPELGLDASETFLYSQTGSSNRAFHRQSYSILAAAKIAKLKSGNTSVLLAITSHDFIVPSVTQWDLAKTYIDSGVRVEVERNYLCGHGSCILPDRNLSAAIQKLNASTSPRTENFVTAGRIRNFKVNATTGRTEPWSSTSVDPLTLEVPRFIFDDAPAPVLATGAIGKRFVVTLKDSTGREFGSVVAIGANGTSRMDWTRSEIPDGVVRLMGIFEVDSVGDPISKVNFISTLRGNPPVEFQRYHDDTRPLGRGVALALLYNLVGQNLERAYVDAAAGVGFLMNYGVLETSRTIASAAEVALVRRVTGRVIPTPTPTPPPVVSACMGGRAVVPSIPSGARACTFAWDGANVGGSAKILSSPLELNGGTLSGTCESTGWTFVYSCADPGVRICTGGGAVIPSASGGKSCYFNWPHTATGQPFSGRSDPNIGNAGGTLTANCVDKVTFAAWENIVAVCP